MKVLITAPWGRRLGGAETMLSAFLQSLDRSRLDVCVVFFEEGPFAEEVRSLDFRTYVVPTRRLRQLRSGIAAVRALAELLRHERPDLLLNWMAKAHLYGAAAAALAGRSDRVVWWQHTVPRPDWLDRLATLLPARAVGCSSNRSAAAQANLWPSRPVFVVHPGIDAPVASTAVERSALRDRLGIPPGRCVVGAVGRLEPGKEHLRFLDVIVELRRRGVEAHGLLVGGSLLGRNAALRSRLDQEAQRRALRDAVTLTGAVPDARPLIELMDVLVSVASAESFGIAIVEAMALGVPVVALGGGGPAEIVEPGRSGLLVVEPDVARIADAVEGVLGDEGLAQRLGRGGRRRFETAFTASRMARDLEDALAELVAA